MRERCGAFRAWLAIAVSACLSGSALAQSTATTQMAIIQAEERGATAARDLVILRSGTQSSTIQTVRMAVRALGRIERPALIADILPSLRHPLPEVRVEAANAIAQAAQGFRTLNTNSGAVSIASTQSA